MLRSLLIADVGRALQFPNGSERFQIRSCVDALIFSPDDPTADPAAEPGAAATDPTGDAAVDPACGPG